MVEDFGLITNGELGGQETGQVHIMGNGGTPTGGAGTEVGPIMAAVEASGWTKDDLDLLLSAVSTALIVYLAVSGGD